MTRTSLYSILFAVVLETPVNDAARREGIFSSSIDPYVAISVSWTGAVRHIL